MVSKTDEAYASAFLKVVASIQRSVIRAAYGALEAYLLLRGKRNARRLLSPNVFSPRSATSARSRSRATYDLVGPFSRALWDTQTARKKRNPALD